MRIGVVGGGLYGSAVAYFLARHGEEVVLFEKGDLGGVSTPRSVGLVRHHYSNEHHIRIVKRSREMMEDLESYIDNDGGFTKNGFLGVAGTESEEAFREIVALQQEVGLDVELLEPGELTEYLPAIDTREIAVGAYERDAGYGDPYLVSTGFARAAEAEGAEIRRQTPVVDVETEGETVTGVETGSGHEPVEYLVNAGGPFAGRVAAMVGVDLPLNWWEVKVIVLTASEPYGPDLPSMLDVDKAFYTKPEQGGEFLVGGFADVEMDEPDDPFETITNDDLLRLDELMRLRLPGYADAEVAESWSGVITHTPDWHQILGVPEGLENVYNVAGLSGHGFKEAPAFAESIADEIAGADPRFDLSPYRLERFERGEELTGRYASAPYLA